MTQIMLDAKRSYKSGQTVLTVYRYENVTAKGGYRNAFPERVVAERTLVPRETSVEDVANILLNMCDMVALRLGSDGYKLRTRTYVKAANRGS